MYSVQELSNAPTYENKRNLKHSRNDVTIEKKMGTKSLA